MTVVGGALVAAPTTAQAAPAVAAPDCVVADDSALRVASPVTSDGWHAYESWAAGADGRLAAEAIGAVLTSTFGEDTKEDRGVTLRAGLVGSTLDHVARQFVVVVDPSLVEAAVLGATLRQTVVSAGSTASVRVAPACRPAADLLAALAVLAERAWAPGADRATFSAVVDPRESTVRAVFAPEDVATAQSLAARLGAAGRVVLGAPSRRDRYNDGSPHYGGAAIGGYNNRFCSSGFTVNISGIGRGGTTAGHCFNNGAAVYSGTNPWGTAGGKVNYPAYDMMRVSSSAQTYANKIHTDPCCPSVRTVTGRANPVVNEYLCVSGYVTLAKCGLRVTSLTAQICDADGCTYGLMRAVKPGETVGASGDSGAPVYIRPTTTSATIKAMEVGGATHDEILAETVNNIEAHLGATVATS